MFIRGRPVQLFVPTSNADSYTLTQVSPAPQLRPKLEWVYGYRGRDARSNLYLLPTGEIVYFVAAVVVLFNAEEHSQRHYMGHTEDIRWYVFDLANLDLKPIYKLLFLQSGCASQQVTDCHRSSHRT